ncbi:MAG: hypothetical protein ACRDTE_10875 [Pseudonocardiaceae bacterium]
MPAAAKESRCGASASASPGTTVGLDVLSPSGVYTSFAALPLVGQEQVPATEHGAYTARLAAAIDLGGERRETTDQITVSVA